MNPIYIIHPRVFFRMTFLIWCILLSLSVYGQRGEVYRNECLSNGDTAVWVRFENDGLRIYFKNEREEYIRLYRYRDTVKTDDMSIWQTYQALLNPAVFMVQEDLGNLLIREFKHLEFDDSHPLVAVFMFNSEGQIVAMSHFFFPSGVPNNFSAEALSDVVERMKREIVYPKMGKGKDYYPWGIRIWPINMKDGCYKFVRGVKGVFHP